MESLERMRLHLCIGFLESRDGPLLGLRDMVEREVLPQFPGTTVQYHSWRDDLCGTLIRQAAAGPAGVPLVLLGHSYGASALVRARPVVKTGSPAAWAASRASTPEISMSPRVLAASTM